MAHAFTMLNPDLISKQSLWTQLNSMKMLFFSADRTEIELVADSFNRAGIPCEIRNSDLGRSLFPTPVEAELWIQNDEDAYKALMLCVEMGIGFARRSPVSDKVFRCASWDVEDMHGTADGQEQEHAVGED